MAPVTRQYLSVLAISAVRIRLSVFNWLSVMEKIRLYIPS